MTMLLPWAVTHWMEISAGANRADIPLEPDKSSGLRLKLSESVRVFDHWSGGSVRLGNGGFWKPISSIPRASAACPQASYRLFEMKPRIIQWPTMKLSLVASKQFSTENRKSVPHGLKPSSTQPIAGRLKPCPSYRVSFPFV